MIYLINTKETKKIISNVTKSASIPYFGHLVNAGFPSPADDFLEKHIDLNEYLIKNKAATFLVRVSGNSMQGVGIVDNDILIIDRSIQARHNHIILAILDGEFTVKRLIKKGKSIILQPENTCYKPIEVSPEQEFKIWGVVTFAIHNL